MRITQDNYYYFVLDYLDGNLNNDQENRLKAFLYAHPNLEEEFCGLSDMFLSPPDISFENKSMLKKPPDYPVRKYVAENHPVCRDISQPTELENTRRMSVYRNFSRFFSGAAAIFIFLFLGEAVFNHLPTRQSKISGVYSGFGMQSFSLLNEIPAMSFIPAVAKEEKTDWQYQPPEKQKSIREEEYQPADNQQKINFPHFFPVDIYSSRKEHVEWEQGSMNVREYIACFNNDKHLQTILDQYEIMQDVTREPAEKNAEHEFSGNIKMEKNPFIQPVYNKYGKKKAIAINTSRISLFQKLY